MSARSDRRPRPYAGSYPCCLATIGQPHALTCEVPLRARALLLAEYDTRGIEFRLDARGEAAQSALEAALTPDSNAGAA